MIGALLVLQLTAVLGPSPGPPAGALNPAITWKTAYKTICARGGWSTKVIRPSSSYTSALKRRWMLALGYTVANPLPLVSTPRGGTRPDIRYCVPRSANPACYELDHVVPLSIGGAPSDERNLWVQPIAEALIKDRLEQTLRASVCAGTVDLVEAQRAIASDWWNAHRVYVEGR